MASRCQILLNQIETGTTCYPLDWAQLVDCMALKQNRTTQTLYWVWLRTRRQKLDWSGWMKAGNKERAREEVDWNDNAATKTGINEKNRCLVGASFFHPTKVPQESVNEENFTWMIKARFVHPCLVSSREVWRKKVKEKTSTQPQIRHEWKKHAHRTRHAYFIHTRYGKKVGKPTLWRPNHFSFRKNHPKRMTARRLMLRLKDDKENDEKKNQK